MRAVGILVRDGYDRRMPNAYLTTRLGYLHGFQTIGAQASFVEHYTVADWIGAQSSLPLLWLTFADYYHLGGEALEAVRECPHIVQVNTWFEGMEALHASFGAPSPLMPEVVLGKIVASKPDFVWCSAPEPYLGEFYAGWKEAGLKVVSLPWACDTERYNWPYALPQFSDVTMAFVGGYRAYKEPQYAARLWPYEDRLKVWGYSKWPRCYQGCLASEDEGTLYGQARICPTLSEPQFYVTGDTVERPFKVMGSGGLTILDMPCYHDLFTTDEALIAPDLDMYHWMVNKVLTDEETNAKYREAGHKAVLERHTYTHRAQKIVEEVGLC
jgi:hypothetical protein